MRSDFSLNLNGDLVALQPHIVSSSGIPKSFKHGCTRPHGRIRRVLPHVPRVCGEVPNAGDSEQASWQEERFCPNRRDQTPLMAVLALTSAREAQVYAPDERSILPFPRLIYMGVERGTSCLQRRILVRRRGNRVTSSLGRSTSIQMFIVVFV